MKSYSETVRLLRDIISRFMGSGEPVPEGNSISLDKESDSEWDSGIKKHLMKFYVEGNPVNFLEHDELFFKVSQYVVLTQTCSIASVQREFCIGLNRAKQILDQIEAAGIVSHYKINEGRKVLIEDELSLLELLNSLPNNKSDRSIDSLDSFYEKYREEIESGRTNYQKLQLERRK